MSRDVVVVGGGAIGVSAALELARRGASVTLVERGPELAWGCSAGNAGLVTPSHAVPLASPENLRSGLRWLFRRDAPLRIAPRPELLPWLARFVAASTGARAERGGRVLRALGDRSLALHEELGRELGTGFRRSGCLYVYETEEAFARSDHPGRRLGPGEAAELEPALRGDVAGAFLQDGEGVCEPRTYVHAVGRAAAQAGVEVRLRTEVRGLRDGLVETSEGGLPAEHVVLAAGAWTRRLAPVPLASGKGYHVDLAPGEGDPRLPIFSLESRVIATPFDGRLRLAGTLDLCGLDCRLDAVRVEAVRRGGERLLGPLSRERDVEVWAGLRPLAPDGLPLLGTLPGTRVVVATGHGMLGLTLAPVTGRIVAQLVAGEPPELDVRALRPDRFRTLRRPVPA